MKQIAEKSRVKITAQNLNLWYGKKHALKDITMEIRSNAVTALIGPSGCGKSTFLRCLNRMNDLYGQVRISGTVLLDGKDIYGKKVDVSLLRKRIGMVFQQPNPFPMSIYNNIAYAPRLYGKQNGQQLDKIVEKALDRAALWEEVKNTLKKPALGLSGGQQQRLCIARALAAEPEVLLLDEPTSALDPVSTLKIETLVRDLCRDYTIVIVTHNMQQAARIADFIAFFLSGELVEQGKAQDVLCRPRDRRTQFYLAGLTL